MEFNRQNTKKIMLIVAFAILLYTGVQNIAGVQGFFRNVIGLLTPFTVGLIMAYIFNVTMTFLELKLPSGKPRGLWSKLRRPLCILLTLVIFVGVILLVCLLVIPELGNTFNLIYDSIPPFIRQIQAWLMDKADSLPAVEQWLTQLNLNWSQLAQNLIGYTQSLAQQLAGSAFSVAVSVINGVVTFVLGFVFAIYVLLNKEKLARQGKSVMYAFLPAKLAERILQISSLSHRVFSSFLTGQCIEAVILGTLCYVGMLLCRFPYAPMIGVLVGFTALIPVFGAFIGAFVGAFLIMMQSPVQAFWFLVFIVLLQQLEGNLIYPRVVGTSVGLPAIWVLVAVTLGASLMGILGMLFFVPVSSVIYTLFKEWTKHRLARRQIPASALAVASPAERKAKKPKKPPAPPKKKN